MPTPTPIVLSMLGSPMRKSAVLQGSGIFALPPETEAPPSPTTAMQVNRYSSPISREDPRR